MKKLKPHFLVVLLLLLGACSYQFEKVEAPEDLIPQDSFRMVLHEVMIIESYFKHQQNNVSQYSEALPEAIQPIFEKYNIDSARYSSSMNYYAAHQKKLIEIYNQIQDSITLNTVEYEQ